MAKGFRPVRRLKCRLAKPIRWRREIDTLKAMAVELAATAKAAKLHSSTAKALYADKLKAIRLAHRILLDRARIGAKVKLLPVLSSEERRKIRKAVLPNDGVDDLFRKE